MLKKLVRLGCITQGSLVEITNQIFSLKYQTFRQLADEGSSKLPKRLVFQRNSFGDFRKRTLKDVCCLSMYVCIMYFVCYHMWSWEVGFLEWLECVVRPSGVECPQRRTRHMCRLEERNGIEVYAHTHTHVHTRTHTHTHTHIHTHAHTFEWLSSPQNKYGKVMFALRVPFLCLCLGGAHFLSWNEILWRFQCYILRWTFRETVSW